MKTYLFACLTGALASSVIAFGNEPRAGSAIELAATAAWPVDARLMARRTEGPWLLRAMTERTRAGTLPSVPCAEPAEPKSL